MVEDVADFVDQDVIKIKVFQRFRCPSQSPFATRFRPATAVHAGFDLLLRSWRARISFDERFFDRIEIDGVAPLHSIAGKQLPFASHTAELNHFNFFDNGFRKQHHPLANVVGSDGMNEARARELNEVTSFVAILRFVPKFLSEERGLIT